MDSLTEGYASRTTLVDMDPAPQAMTAASVPAADSATLLFSAPAHPTAPAQVRRAAAPLLKRLRANRWSLGGALLACSIAWLAGDHMLGGTRALDPAYRGLIAALSWTAVAAGLVAAHAAATLMMRVTPTRRFRLMWPVFAVIMAAAFALAAFMLPLRLVSVMAIAAGAGLGFQALVDVLLRRYVPVRIGVIGGDNHRLSVNGLNMDLEPVSPGQRLAALDGIILMPGAERSPQWHAVSQRAALGGCIVATASAYQQWLTGRRPVPDATDDDVIMAPGRAYLKLRRLFDLTLAFVLLVPVSLIVGVTAVLIRLESPGPAIFRQRRVGYRRRPFTCYKLRSMRTDMPGGAFTGTDDPRITPIGHIIRKYRIDELPQIFNILRGEMSWIGPRPEAIGLAARYRLGIPGYSYRYMVPPGITGWAAVHQGNVGDVDAARIKLEYDFYYIRHVSPWMDLLIIFKTIQVILSGFGSK
jgi:lipopolysaccharide/colanic/teichoic acid biosynthesis glycosyltransferase